MILRFFNLSRLAALLLFAGLAFGAAPASAGCGYDGCYAPVAPVIVQPVFYPSCSCCGCGSSYYTSYYGAYTYPSYSYGYGCGGCGGYGYGVGYGYATAVATAMALATPVTGSVMASGRASGARVRTIGAGSVRVGCTPVVTEPG